MTAGFHNMSSTLDMYKIFMVDISVLCK